MGYGLGPIGARIWVSCGQECGLLCRASWGLDLCFVGQDCWLLFRAIGGYCWGLVVA